MPLYTPPLLVSDGVTVSTTLPVAFPDSATPSAPADGVKLFSSEIAGHSMLSTIGPSGLMAPLQPSVAHKQVGMWSASAGAAVVYNFGVMGAANIALGGMVARVTDNASFCTSQNRLGVVSAATAAQAATIRGTSTYPKLWRGNAARLGGFYVVLRFNISDAVLVGTANMFAGITFASLATDVAPSTLINLIGIGCDSGDTTMQLYAAGSGAQPRVSLGASFPMNTTNVDVYEATFYSPPNSSTVSYRVLRLNTGDVVADTVSVAANLPASNLVMSPQIFRSNGGTAAAVGFDFSHVYVETP